MIKSMLSMFGKQAKTISIRIIKGHEQTVVNCKVGSEPYIQVIT